MDGEQIKNILKSLPETACFFKGIFISSELPSSFATLDNGFIIVNSLEKSSDKIGHWLVFFARNRVLYYFDSFGLLPSHYNAQIASFYSNYSHEKQIVFDSPVQADDSYTCGAYAVYFSYLMSLGNTIYHIKGKFGKNRKNNDKFVSKFIFKKTGTLKSCNPQYCSSYMFGMDCREYCKC